MLREGGGPFIGQMKIHQEIWEMFSTLNVYTFLAETLNVYTSTQLTNDQVFVQWDERVSIVMMDVKQVLMYLISSSNGETGLLSFYWALRHYEKDL